MEVITQHLCKSSDIGLRGNLFGGTMLSWLDDAGFIFASKVCRTPSLVTVCFEEVVFKKPLKEGDLVTIMGKVTHIGNTSIKVYLEAKRWLFGHEQEKETITSTSIVFVKIDTQTHCASPIEHAKR